MPRRKLEASQEVWISANEAASILTANTDHTVGADYVRWLATKGKLTWRSKNRREKEYLKDSVEAYRVRPLSTPRVRPRPSTRKQKAIEEPAA
jgi:hypothetical protein